MSAFEATSGATSPAAGLAPPEWGGFDPARTRGGPGDVMRAFKTSTVLGWQMEANWTDPILFFIYSVAKPVASALILVFMLEVIAGGSRPEYRAFVVVGSALWAFVLSGMSGLAWTVLDDRERYRMLKYVYVSPSDFLVVLLGRGVARVAVGGMGALITLLFGVLLLGVPFDFTTVNWPLFVVVMASGLVSIVAIGVMLAAVCLQTRQESWSYPEAVGGALFLVSGAVFPIVVLPQAVQAIGLLTPLSWWIEGIRQSLFPGGITSVGGDGSLFQSLTGQPVPAPAQIVVALLVTGTVATLASIAVFRTSDRRAKDRGLLDRTTGS
ncbi:MAG TPA: ABC transporter permease [Candidatus Limnocylindrales bacterium]|nr:ABC transporter permease [Candidatus Limnocylindrales bacterium]